ncbi:Acyl-CoA dehydrogenase [Massilia sp. PDC64]|nr:acyl-CoA dehydrogenase family protein [Massilia sp. PDC64]SDD21731.1 Acyl-CoA dehydrogenase [Massilia sp. PDC64]
MHLALHPVPASSDGHAHQAPAPDPFDPIAAAHDLAARLATDALGRDRHWIRKSGLLALSVPRDFGGLGASWKTIADVVRIVARADSALAHLLGVHHLQIAGIRLTGSARQQRRLLFETIEQDVFWGDALNPLDKRLVARPTAGGYILDGVKAFPSGFVGSDWLTVCAWDPLAHGSLVAVLPTERDGVSVHADWDAFGLRQADGATVSFTNVQLTEDDVLQPAARAAAPQAALRAQVAQLMLANVYLGMAEGALEATRGDVRGQAQPWCAQVLADAAASELDDAFARGPHLTKRERGEVALVIAEAKDVAHKAVIGIGRRLFEPTAYA